MSLVGIGIGVWRTSGGGGAPAVTPSTWNPADKDASITLSGGDLTATHAGGGLQGVRSTLSRTGKRYAEFLIVEATNASPAIANLTASTAAYFGVDTNGVMLYGANGQVLYNGAALPGVTEVGLADGVVIGIAFDQPNSLIWFLSNNTALNGNPGAGTGGLSVPGIGAVPYLGFTGQSDGAAVTLRTTAASFTYTPPTGFAAWDS